VRAELVEYVTLPNGTPAWIHVYRGKGNRYGAQLVFADGKRLPMSVGHNHPGTATEAMLAAQRFMNTVYGKSN
jgi:hypothetical protein